ncbi:MAG: phosphatase PAP2 family protein [Candidatus Margulisbacteria bacterium]|nr:phosphatase PAP2 family protein [Candidatus Margulisiibacteriota bacterium]
MHLKNCSAFFYFILVQVLLFASGTSAFHVSLINVDNNQLSSVKKQQSDTATPFNYFVVNDLLDIAVRPDNILSRQNILTWTLPTLFFYATDRDSTNFFNTEIEARVRSLRLDFISDKFLYNSLFWAYMAGESLHDDALSRFAYCAGEAVTDALFLAQSIKHVVGRARPVLTNEGPYSWFHGKSDIFGEYTSFPSSHATIYFSFSTVLGKAIGNEWLGDLCGLLGFSSLSGHNHWMSDMWMGYLLGKSIGNYVWDKRKNEKLDNKWFIYPAFIDGIESDLPAICFSTTF